MDNSREASVKQVKEREMENKLSNREIMKKKKKKLSYYLIPRFPCMRLDDGVTVAETPAGDGSFEMEAGCSGRRDHSPTHLVVTVNGIIGSAQNWRYAAKQFVKAYPDDVLVHCSQSNTSMLTFDGVDVMGKRLADEVVSVVGHHPNLQKISFLGHSLGGLIARYAVAVLYQQNVILPKNIEQSGGECVGEEKQRGVVAGLEPVNFITFATPHLGSRGHKQVPVFCGVHTMERLATRASFLLGRTGRHLFLSDSDDGKAPILLRMSSDSEDLKFISSLQSFKRRAAYANVRFDNIVGWSSSSMRRLSELPKCRSLERNAKYPHIVNEEKANAVISPQREVPLEIKAARGRTKDMEETMIRGLTRLNWERVDVSFTGSVQWLLAHSTIQVKTQCINSEGADVIQHMIDNFVL
ncbi:putative lipase ROG1 isoform X2 [Salvia splendens]|uniref:putative lipase ROG1 isoform X2 n=1 Tax=Salvia splendens TaxID=180675 RepID=UPI001C26AAE7|nr:putative lipase ROG1 isoform X2 [Salvia splendens]